MFKGVNSEMAIGVDLGTANTLIIQGEQVIVDEPSIIAIDVESNKVLAVGGEAMLMHEKTHPNIKTVKPLRDGVIADFTAAELMIREFVRKVRSSQKSLFAKSLKMLICIPSGITEVEKRAVKDSAIHAGASEVVMIYEPMAAAIGAGLDVNSSIGFMIVDIGGGTTEIAILSLSGIVSEHSIRVAGNSFTNDIVDFVRKQHNLLIGEKTAEQIKIHAGSAVTELEEDIPNYEMVGRDLMTGIPKVIEISYQEVAFAIEKSLAKVEESIMKSLESAPPELSSDIYRNGIYVSGGGALLRGLAKRFSNKTRLKINIVEDPLKAVVRGTGIAVRDRKKYKTVLIH